MTSYASTEFRVHNLLVRMADEINHFKVRCKRADEVYFSLCLRLRREKRKLASEA